MASTIVAETMQSTSRSPPCVTWKLKDNVSPASTVSVRHSSDFGNSLKLGTGEMADVRAYCSENGSTVHQSEVSEVVIVH
jgi:hypothetical protein